MIIDQFKDTLLVSVGALLGANIRFILYEKLKKYFLINHFPILTINIFASFCLGLFVAILPRISSYNYSYQLILFFSIGLLGSLSTFSTFVYDLYEIFIKFKFLSAFKLFFISTAFGIISLAFGFFLGTQ